MQQLKFLYLFIFVNAELQQLLKEFYDVLRCVRL